MLFFATNILSCKKEQEVAKEKPIKIDTFYYRFSPEDIASSPYFIDKRFDKFGFRDSKGDTFYIFKESFDSSYTWNSIYDYKNNYLRINYYQRYSCKYVLEDWYFPEVTLTKHSDKDISWLLEVSIKDFNLNLFKDDLYRNDTSIIHYDMINIGGNTYYDVVKMEFFMVETKEKVETFYYSKKEGIICYIDLLSKDTTYLLKE